jgi:hypothetical protein
MHTLILLIAWSLRKERNNRTFSRAVAHQQDLFRKVLREAEDWVQAGFKTLAAVCPLWSRSIVVM